MVWIWVSVIIGTLVFEFITYGLICIWFSIAGVIALILEICGVSVWTQVIVFSVVSLGLLLGLRRICLKLLKGNNEKTNSDSLVGKKVKLVKAIIGNEVGEVKINGVVWNAISVDGGDLNQDEIVEIVEIIGNKIIVKKGE